MAIEKSALGLRAPTQEEREIAAIIARLEYLRKIRQARVEAAETTGLPLNSQQLDELLGVTREPVFLVAGARRSLSALLLEHSDDADLCAWARAAQVGDVYLDFVPCERLS